MKISGKGANTALYRAQLKAAQEILDSVRSLHAAQRTCERCSHEWVPKSPFPKRCPKCKKPIRERR
jgi:predicted Zn-ribbon and HTH transcriptional regulator